jgi:hypothetical protein
VTDGSTKARAQPVEQLALSMTKTVPALRPTVIDVETSADLPGIAVHIRH